MSKLDTEAVTEQALKRSEDLITFYEKQKNRMRIRDNVLQSVIILATGATAFAAAVDKGPKWVVAIPAVITAIASSFNVVFRFRAKYVSFAIAAERLKSESLRFRYRMESVPNKNLETFIDRIDDIVNTELGEWRDLHQEQALPSITNASHAVTTSGSAQQSVGRERRGRVSQLDSSGDG